MDEISEIKVSAMAASFEHERSEIKVLSRGRFVLRMKVQKFIFWAVAVSLEFELSEI
jgi:hypothetical protein